MNEAEVQRLIARLPRRRAEIVSHLWVHPEGATADELRRAFSVTPNQVAPEVTGLAKGAIIEWRGEYRDTELGKRAKVYHLAGQVAAEAEPPWMGCAGTLSGRHAPSLGRCTKCGERLP